MNPDYSHLTPATAELLAASDSDRITLIQEERWITFPRVRVALEALEDLLARPRTTRMRSIAIYADSGMGKTMLMERFKRAHPAVYSETERRSVSRTTAAFDPTGLLRAWEHVAGLPFAAGAASKHFGLKHPSRQEAQAVKSPRSSVVPKSMQATYDAVVALTDGFCGDHLNGEYRDLAQAMTAALCRKRPSPLSSGQPRTWACGIIHVLGRLNFLSDKASQPYMTMAEVSAAFGVGESTASAKARAISDALHTNRMDPTWMLKSIVALDPFVWMAEVNGMLVDIRDMPREVQVIAYEKGMIPYIPADQG